MNNSADYAKQQSQAYKDSLQYLIENQNNQHNLDIQSTDQKYNNLIDIINRQRQPIQETYQNDAQQAYINKMMAGKSIDQNLNRLGVNTQGYGVTQRALNESAYGNNLSALQVDRNKGLRDLDNQVLSTEGDRLTTLLGVDADYAGRLLELNKYIEGQTKDTYEFEYGAHFGNVQYEAEQARKNREEELKRKEYADRLAQIAWENAFKEKQLREQIRQANQAAAINRAKVAPPSYPINFTGDPKTNPPAENNTNSSGTVSTRQSPAFFSSEAARNWYHNGLGKLSAQGSISIVYLESELTKARSSGLITDADINNILKIYK